ncbi:RICIN domain-containing protein, partial [Streptomyces chrestomyceticus]|uniref:RICIN domain-containing protein n=1 Tax=Streptomyces chrestomyceticus TaxID=68185 RepID=UPI0033E5CE63
MPDENPKSVCRKEGAIVKPSGIDKKNRLRAAVLGAAGLLAVGGFAGPADASSTRPAASSPASVTANLTGQRPALVQPGQASLSSVAWANAKSGKCLEVENSSTKNGARAQQWDCKGQAGASWNLRDGGGSKWLI